MTHLQALSGGGEATPWRVWSFVAPGRQLSVVAKVLDLDPLAWRRVAGMWEQDAEEGLWRVDLQDLLLLYAPRFEPLPERWLPVRPLDLDLACHWLYRAGLATEKPMLLGASGWEERPDLPQLSGSLEGYLALRCLWLAESPHQDAWGRRRLPLELRAHGEVLGPDLETALYAAEVAYGLRRYERYQDHAEKFSRP